MNKLEYDVVVIGAGPAGLAAAIEAKKKTEKVLIVERDSGLGGILQQCIHPGFGLHIFDEELTGPEYAHRFIEELESLDIDLKLDTMVLNIDENSIYGVNKHEGMCQIDYKSLVLAMGCRERTRGAIGIPGTRPAGVFTAGTAQRFINMQGYMVGKKVVILGSGDIGMIMARRLTLEGAKVEAVIELLPYVSGLIRNKVQCLDDFNIPLYLGHTVTDIQGKNRVEKVTVAKVDQNMNPLKETSWDIGCDTLLLSVGLIPENELSKEVHMKFDSVTKGPIVNQNRETSIAGIFACGNVLHVNDLVDNVTLESQIAGRAAAEHALNKKGKVLREVDVVAGNKVRYAMPQKIHIFKEDENDDITLYFRITEPSKNVKMQVICEDKIIGESKALRVSPGEMQSIKIKKDLLKNITGDITVKVLV